MKQSLQLKLGQSLAMTPQLQQAIRLLQLSSLELQTEIQDALESNMMLEVEEQSSEAASEQETSSANNDSESLPDPIPADSIPDELPVDTDWESVFDTTGSFNRSSGSHTSLDDDGFNLLENQDAGETTLQEELLWQLNLIPCSELDKTIAMTIIDALDDDGYLTCSLEELVEIIADEEVEIEEVAAALRMVQNMEPTGVAARDLGECLLLQLKQLPSDTAWLVEATTLLKKYLDLLQSRDFTQLQRKLKLDREQLQSVLALIQSLNPRPGGEVHSARIEYITPDVYVKKVKGVWKVELNGESMPKLRINAGYASMIRRADNSADNNSLKDHLQEAKWFIKSLQSRSETLLRVATCIVERQRGFLEYGEEAMKPLVLNDIAEALELHESTISRVTTRKYMHTPRGIFELKYFFSSHVSTEQGGACSSTAIRALIKKFIAAEKPEKPLSDNKIATLLSEQGIQVARRTVAKYREAMAIPPSNERKRLI